MTFIKKYLRERENWEIVKETQEYEMPKQKGYRPIKCITEIEQFKIIETQNWERCETTQDLVTSCEKST